MDGMGDMNLVKRFGKNAVGRDFVIGDIHGHFTKAKLAIDSIGFDYSKDRMFSVGDLVDRGPESDSAIEFLKSKWFHPVRGNHEEMAIDYAVGIGEPSWYIANGGAWNVSNPKSAQDVFRNAFLDIPIAIEVATSRGLVGVVHANVPYSNWQLFTKALENGESDAERSHVIAMAQWDRSRAEGINDCYVKDVRAVVVGHTPMHAPQTIGNVIHIDTGGWLKESQGYGKFTILDLETLEVVS